jgi:hypothetical protein
LNESAENSQRARAPLAWRATQLRTCELKIGLKRMIGPREKPFFIKWSHRHAPPTSARKSGADTILFLKFEFISRSSQLEINIDNKILEEYYRVVQKSV